MRRNVKTIDVAFPLVGLERRVGYQHESAGPHTTPDCLNVRSRDVFLGRLRGGSRPGLVQVLPPKYYEIDDPPVVVTNTMVFVPTKDTYIQSDTGVGLPKGNNQSAGLIVTRKMRIFFHFDLSAIPTGATIVSATFINHGYSGSGAGDIGELMWVRRMTQTGWSETFRTGSGLYGTTGWNYYDENNLLSWTTPGGDMTDTDQVEWALGPYPSGEFQITGLATLVTDAITNRSKQLHIALLRQDETVTGYQAMSSREWGLSFPATGPRLSVEYAV